MPYIIRNLTAGEYSCGGVTWKKGEQKTLERVNAKIAAEVERGVNLSSAQDPTPITGLAAITNSLTTITNTTGTPVAPTSGALTLATISDVATAANAIATLAAENNRVKTLMTAVLARMALLEASLVELQADAAAVQKAR